MQLTPFPVRIARFALLLVHFARGLGILAFRFQVYSDSRRRIAVRRWSRRLLSLVGVRVSRHGSIPAAGLLVLNHISWLDIFVLNSVAPSRFVSKSEVARWPLVGYLCTRSGTLYIERARKTAARRANQAIAQALERGERVAVFPEGTTTPGDTLLHFHAALLQPAVSTGGEVHPATLRYLSPQGGRSPHVSYVGDESLVGSIWQLLGARQVVARIDFDRPEAATGRARRELASALHATINRRLNSDIRDS